VKLAAMSARSKVLSKNGISCNNSIKHPIKKENENEVLIAELCLNKAVK